MLNDEDVKVAVFKLVTGEEILAEVKVRMDRYEVRNPVLVVRVPTQEGKMNIVFLPMAPFANTKDFFDIDRKHIVWDLPPVDDMKNQYKQMLGQATLVIPKRPELIVG